MLMAEILSQLDRSLLISSIRNANQIQKKLEKIYEGGMPDLIIIGHHPPDLNAMQIVPYIKGDSRFDGIPLYVMGDHPAVDDSYWLQSGVTRYLQFFERASLLKSALSSILPKKKEGSDMAP